MLDKAWFYKNIVLTIFQSLQAPNQNLTKNAVLLSYY